MESIATRRDAKAAARELEQARDGRRAAAWILVLAMAISAIVAMVLTVILQRP